MKTAFYVWQFDVDYPGPERDDRNLPMDEVWVKTHDAVYWMGHAYQHPAAPVSAASVAHLVQLYAQNGVRFTPWCVPTGANIDAETALACEVLDGMAQAGVEKRLVFDVELDSTPNFWKGTPQSLRRLIEGVRARHPDAYLILCHYQYAEIGFDQVQDLFDAFSTMDYWTDFRMTPEARLNWSYDRLAKYGKPIIWGFPGDATADDMARALRWVEQRGGKVVIWRRGTTTPAVLEAVRAYEPAPPKQPPVVEPPTTHPPVSADELTQLRFRIERAGECLLGDFPQTKEALDQLYADLRATLPPVAQETAPKRPLRTRLPHPWMTLGIGAGVVAGQALIDAIHSGALQLPETAATGAVVMALTALVGLLRQQTAEE